MKAFTILTLLLAVILSTSEIHAQKDSTHFVTTWRTDNLGFSNDSAIYIEIDTTYIYNFDIDWDDDGIFDTLGVNNSILIQYPSPGTYTVRIRSIYPSIYFSSTGFFPNTVNYDQDKIISIDQWGTNPWQNLSSAFLNCSKLTNNTTDAPNLTSVTDLYNMFSGASSFNADLSNWDVSTITNMAYMFQAAFTFNGNVTNWDVSNVRVMNAMFADAYNFNQDISAWNVSSVYSTDLMFANSGFNQDISNWNLNSSRMGGMFLFARHFNQDISSWNIQNTFDMVSLFDSSGLSRTNYDRILNAWQAKPHQLNVTLGAGGIKYCLGDSARTLLIADGWSFNGDSLDCSAVGINEIRIDNKFKVYPNPTTDYIQIESDFEIKKVNVFSIHGQLVKTIKSSIVDFTNLPKGNYIIEVQSDFAIERRKILKN